LKLARIGAAGLERPVILAEYGRCRDISSLVGEQLWLGIEGLGEQRQVVVVESRES
jgi:hypothetical protein